MEKTTEISGNEENTQTNGGITMGLYNFAKKMVIRSALVAGVGYVLMQGCKTEYNAARDMLQGQMEKIQPSSDSPIHKLRNAYQEFQTRRGYHSRIQELESKIEQMEGEHGRKQ